MINLILWLEKRSKKLQNFFNKLQLERVRRSTHLQKIFNKKALATSCANHLAEFQKKKELKK
jgi:hypothetical protein